MNTSAIRPASFGALGFALMLAAYFAVLTLVSGWSFTLSQFSDSWYYIVPLAAGFGVQVALFIQLRRLLHQSVVDARGVVAASGTTSTLAMVSCCAHYLVNVAPVLGATGLVTFAAQYQVQFFWVGIAFNLAGIAFIGSRLWKSTKEHASCALA